MNNEQQTKGQNETMKTTLIDGMELTNERSESSYGIPVLVINGDAYGRGDVLPEPYCTAGYDQKGNHTGRGEDKCRLAGVLVRAHAHALTSCTPERYEFIKSFYS
jgi:hypothetical protein